MVFGRLTVISLHHKDASYRMYWLCKCSCGNEKVVRGDHLITGTASCGCSKKERCVSLSKYKIFRGSHKSKTDYQVCSNTLYRNYRAGAIARNYEFTLSIDEFIYVTQLPCFYCGDLPKQIIKMPRYPEGFTYNGIDRVDNSKGYTISNIVPCCGICNFAKNKMSLDEFIAMVNKIYNHNRTDDASIHV
jgi:hypothetical protein